MPSHPVRLIKLFPLRLPLTRRKEYSRIKARGCSSVGGGSAMCVEGSGFYPKQHTDRKGKTIAGYNGVLLPGEIKVGTGICSLRPTWATQQAPSQRANSQTTEERMKALRALVHDQDDESWGLIKCPKLPALRTSRD